MTVNKDLYSNLPFPLSDGDEGKDDYPTSYGDNRGSPMRDPRLTPAAVKKKRRDAVKKRAAALDSDVTRCMVFSCRNPARAATEEGLDRRFCRSHADHYARHGSPYKRSYAASELAPHRKVVASWLKANEDDRWVRNAIERVRGRMQSAGPHVEAFRLRGLSPELRASAAWARLRKAKVDPMRVVEAWLVLELTIAHDPDPENKREFKRVQGAKLVHRLASGTHKKWEGAGGRATELHVYPRSRGRVLRHLGQDVEEAVELLWSKSEASIRSHEA